MTEQIIATSNDHTVIELVPREEDHETWSLLAHMSDYLHRHFGLEIDCDTVLITLVYHGEQAEALPFGGDARP